MKPLINLAQARTADGSEITLHSKDTHFFLRVNREPLMATNAPESEMVMARLACKPFLHKTAPRVLIGGLGFGFTLRQTLELLGKGAEVEVAEIVPEVVAWNREFLGEVNGKLLADPRVKIVINDVFEVIKKARDNPYDAILMDVDNGASALVLPGNDRIYRKEGLVSFQRALRPNGRLVFWCATADRVFEKQLSRAGFSVESVPAKAHVNAKRAAHTLIVADLPEVRG